MFWGGRLELLRDFLCGNEHKRRNKRIRPSDKRTKKNWRMVCITRTLLQQLLLLLHPQPNRGGTTSGCKALITKGVYIRFYAVWKRHTPNSLQIQVQTKKLSKRIVLVAMSKSFGSKRLPMALGNGNNDRPSVWRLPSEH